MPSIQPVFCAAVSCKAPYPTANFPQTTRYQFAGWFFANSQFGVDQVRVVLVALAA
jgi:hypothetical protein